MTRLGDPATISFVNGRIVREGTARTRPAHQAGHGTNEQSSHRLRLIPTWGQRKNPPAEISWRVSTL